MDVFRFYGCNLCEMDKKSRFLANLPNIGGVALKEAW